eukprot:1457407-Pyramimonas_sp.AAC.1
MLSGRACSRSRGCLRLGRRPSHQRSPNCNPAGNSAGHMGLHRQSSRHPCHCPAPGAEHGGRNCRALEVRRAGGGRQ